MTTVLAHESELEFELGGPAYRLMQRIGLIRGAGPSIGRRIVGFLLITWVPLLLFSLIEGRALGPTPRESLLLDFATYARFFLAVPLLFVAEVVVGPRLRTAGLHFIQADFVRPEELPAVEAAIVRAGRRREALLPELVMLGIALFGAWYLSIEAWSSGTTTPTWSSATLKGGTGLSLAGIWYHFVAVPILQFFMLRWLWRLLIWTFFLRDIARLKLKLLKQISRNGFGRELRTTGRRCPMSAASYSIATAWKTLPSRWSASAASAPAAGSRCFSTRASCPPLTLKVIRSMPCC